MRLVFVLSIMIVAFLSCEESNTVLVEREVADCCNPWDQTAGANVENAVKLFLETHGVDVLEIEMRDSGRIAYCSDCCKCPIGKFVRLRIARQQLERVELLGFFEE